jgi:general secretion pathway protein G
MRKKQNGFTLIELLVTISIIAVLTTLLMANFIGVRQRGRDGQRKSNLYQLRSALELYRTDHGSYPTTLATCGTGASLNYTDPNPPNTVTTYMQTIPCDPLTGSPFKYTSDGTTYSLVACLENQQDADKDATDVSCSSPYVVFKVVNP